MVISTDGILVMGGYNPSWDYINDVWRFGANLDSLGSSNVKAAMGILTQQIVDSVGSFKTAGVCVPGKQGH